MARGSSARARFPRPLTKRGWASRIASLEGRAVAGDVEAQADLGLTLLEGIQDRGGRAVVRRNPRAALAWLQRAATRGHATAASALGFAHDVGLGTKASPVDAARWYRRAVRGGSCTAANNLATVHRDAGNQVLAFRWWVRGERMGDGDAAVDVGYACQYGIGTRKDARRAKRMYRRAIASRSISQYGREAAMYHLALQLIDEGSAHLARPLLIRATVDGDYPEAANVLRQVESGAAHRPCRCKRGLRKTLLGHAPCPKHRR